MRVYLSGEIHTNWRQEIIRGSQGLNVTFDGPITDHELSDDCGVMIMGSEPDKFWHDNKGAKLNAIRTRKGLMDCLLYTSPSPRDGLLSRMPSSA